MLATTIHKSNTTPHHQSRATTTKLSTRADPKPAVKPPPVSHTRDEEVTGLLSQSPIVCLAIPSPQNSTEAESRCGSTFVVHQAGATTATRLLTAQHPHSGSV